MATETLFLHLSNFETGYKARDFYCARVLK
jgi:hypothetical protein